MTKTTVTRSTLVDALTQEVGLSKNETAELLGDFLRAVMDGLVKGKKIKIQNFGTFSVRHKKSRIGRNPKTGEEAQISARRVVVFKPSQKLKTQVNDPDAPQRVQVKRAAHELVERHGDAALVVARERVDLQESTGKRSEVDLAMLVLTEVERLVSVE